VRNRVTRPRHAVAALTLAALAVLLPAAPAYAHSQLQRTAPAAGAVVTAPVTRVTLTFNEMVRGNFTTVVVDGPGGVSYSHGPVEVVDHDVFQPVYPLRSGGYEVAWRAVSADGHPVEGRFAFTVSLPPAQEPSGGPPASPSPAPGTRRGTPPWPAIFVALILGAAAIALRSRARGPGPRGPIDPTTRT
jgi:methionine-rich copper-binding protein CopC